MHDINARFMRCGRRTDQGSPPLFSSMRFLCIRRRAASTEEPYIACRIAFRNLRNEQVCLFRFFVLFGIAEFAGFRQSNTTAFSTEDARNVQVDIGLLRKMNHGDRQWNRHRYKRRFTLVHALEVHCLSSWLIRHVS